MVSKGTREKIGLIVFEAMQAYHVQVDQARLAGRDTHFDVTAFVDRILAAVEEDRP